MTAVAFDELDTRASQLNDLVKSMRLAQMRGRIIIDTLKLIYRLARGRYLVEDIGRSLGADTTDIPREQLAKVGAEFAVILGELSSMVASFPETRPRSLDWYVHRHMVEFRDTVEDVAETLALAADEDVQAGLGTAVEELAQVSDPAEDWRSRLAKM